MRVVTIDAMGGQKAIIRKIVDGGGDYVLAVKGSAIPSHDRQRLKRGVVRSALSWPSPNDFTVRPAVGPDAPHVRAGLASP